MITEKSLDIIVLTKTWLGNKDCGKIADLQPDIYLFYHIPSQICMGGVGVLLSKRYTHVKMIKSQVYASFEYLQINFSLTDNLFKFTVLYRLPLRTNFNDFVNEFYGLMSSVFDENRKVYIWDDFDI